MPELARFNGIVISIGQWGKEHNPPHVHARYSGVDAKFELLKDGSINVIGKFPNRQEKEVRAWINDNWSFVLKKWEQQENEG